MKIKAKIYMQAERQREPGHCQVPFDDDTGYYAIIADSEGNCLGLYANS